jgi:hypothetical protein
MKRFSLFIAASMILSFLTPLASSNAAEKYELLDTSRSKCHNQSNKQYIQTSADVWTKCLDAAKSPSVKFEIISKQIAPGAPLKLRLYFNFNVQPLDGWFNIGYFQKAPEINDVSRLGNLAQATLEIYCPNTSFQPYYKFNIINLMKDRTTDLSAFESFFASGSKKIPAVIMFSNGTYDLETILPSSCKEVEIDLLQGVSQGVLMQDFRYVNLISKSESSSGTDIAWSRQEGTKKAFSFKTSGKAPVLTKQTIKPSPPAKCSSADLKKYKKAKEQFIYRNSIIQAAKEIKHIIETKRENLSLLYGYYVDYTQKNLYDLQQQDKLIEKTERERAEWEPELRTLAKKCGFPMTSKTEILPNP